MPPWRTTVRVQRAENASLGKPDAGIPVPQKKSIVASSRTSVGLPARKRLPKYSPSQAWFPGRHSVNLNVETTTGMRDRMSSFSSARTENPLTGSVSVMRSASFVGCSNTVRIRL